MSVPTIVLVGANTGGVGKTTVARSLIDYLEARRIVACVFDTESPNGDLIRFCPQAEVVDIGRVENQMRIFDGVGSDSITVIDLRAGMLSETINALDEARLLADVRNGSMNLTLLHVLGPTIASINEVARAADSIGTNARHFIVKNHINESGFFEWDATVAKPVFDLMANLTINVGHLPAIACETMQARGGSYISFVADAGQSKTLRGRVRSWLDTVWREYDNAKLLNGAGEKRT
jgi:hypothetical protein